MSRQLGIIVLEIEENIKGAENALSSLESLKPEEKHFFYKFDCAYTDLNNHFKEIKRLREELLEVKIKEETPDLPGI